MNRKKFFALFSTGIIGMTFLKANPFKLITGNKNENKKIKVKINPDAVKRDKSGNKNG